MSLPALDTSLFFLINGDLRGNFLDVIMPFVTRRAYLVFLPFCAWFLLKDRKKAFLALVLGIASFLIADWASNALKHVFERPRPCIVLEGVRALMGCGKSFSMPSNHAANSFAFMTPFVVLMKGRIRYAFPAIAVLVAFSRVYVGVHYPSDVLVGACLGALVSLAVLKLYGWSSLRYQGKPHSTVLMVSLIAISLFRIYYIVDGPLDLGPDEAHYWEWSRRLDLSYYSKGPMIAYLIYLGTHIFGDTVFGIRIMAVTFSALSSICLYHLGKRLYDERVGLCSALLLQIIPLFSAYGILFTIDSPFIFFWILSLFLFREAVNRGLHERETYDKLPPHPPLAKRHRVGKGHEILYWCLLGLSIGLGLLTKYTMAFFYLCGFLFLFFSKEQRGFLSEKGPYIAVFISLLVFSPVIIWNANYDWVTLRHTAGQAHVAEGLRISVKSFLQFMGSQLVVITPLLFLLTAVSIWYIRRKAEGDFLFWFSVPVFVFFLLKSVQAKVQANWALPCYITGIVAFSSFYLVRFGQERKVEKVLIASAVILSLIITSVMHYPSALNLPVSIDPASRLKGWKELGEEVSSPYEKMSSAHPSFVFSDRYQVSSELAFYVKGHPVTYCVNLGRRMNQYDLWPGFSNLVHYDAIFVTVDDIAVPKKISSAFSKVEKKVFTAYTKKHAKIRDYSIFLCYDFRGFNEERPETF